MMITGEYITIIEIPWTIQNLWVQGVFLLYIRSYSFKILYRTFDAQII